MRNLYLFWEVNISFVVLNVWFNTVQDSWLLTCSLFFVISAMLDNYSKSDTSKPWRVERLVIIAKVNSLNYATKQAHWNKNKR